MDWMNEVAVKKVGGPEGWSYCRWQRIGDGEDFVVEGGIPRLLKAGPRKGEKTWRDVPTQKTVVTRAEMDAAQLAYEATTGTCGDCGGTREVFARWTKDNGTEMRQCTRCNGTGLAPNDSAKGRD